MKGIIPLPTRKSGIKELRKNRIRHLHNLDMKTDLKKTIKKYLASIEKKDKTEAESHLTLVFKKLDKATKQHILAKNTASRRKSRFSKLLTQLTS